MACVLKWCAQIIWKPVFHLKIPFPSNLNLFNAKQLILISIFFENDIQSNWLLETMTLHNKYIDYLVEKSTHPDTFIHMSIRIVFSVFFSEKLFLFTLSRGATRCHFLRVVSLNQCKAKIFQWKKSINLKIIFELRTSTSLAICQCEDKFISKPDRCCD